MSEVNEHQTDIDRPNNSLVFISHDTRDAKLAEAFSNLLKSVSDYVDIQINVPCVNPKREAGLFKNNSICPHNADVNII